MRWGPNATRLAATFMLGVASALWLFPVLLGPRVQQLRIERDEAKAKVESLQAEVLKLKEAERTRQDVPTVRRVKVEITGVDKRVKVEAERRLVKLLNEEHVGRPIDDISAMIIYRELQGTELEIDGVDYDLSILFMSIGTELTLHGELSTPKSEKPKEKGTLP